jgi:hypothetical protein
MQTSDARSQIVREACGLVISILPFLADFSEDVARVLLPQLWKLAYVSLYICTHTHTAVEACLRQFSLDIMFIYMYMYIYVCM